MYISYIFGRLSVKEVLSLLLPPYNYFAYEFWLVWFLKFSCIWWLVVMFYFNILEIKITVNHVLAYKL